MKDNFSSQSSAYAKFRPHYPDEMIDYIVALAPEKNLALDIATGNGQVAKKLSPYFKTVYATDISENQLKNAVPVPNVIYKKEAAEKTGFTENSFDLITVAQAIHWFQFEEFYKEIYRILKPEGIFAMMGYGLFSTNPDSDKILLNYYHNIVGPYWDAERKYIDELYQTIPFPLEELPAQKFSNHFNWTFGQLIGYLETWSATQHYKDKNNRNPIDLIRNELKASWENSDLKVTFPLLLRIGKLKP
ncbi:MAG TPA: methyltransferase domain-containing protein [Flavobacterium sp.]|nr:methyltransferase domain-containing protein [Flavobacterium sp.]